MRLDAALNNMIQGLCMFDAQNRLLVWNERYRAMYNIDPKRIWRGCSIRDLLDARVAAGTFPLEPAQLRRRVARRDQARQHLHHDRRIGRRPHRRRRQPADQRRRLGGDARRYHRTPKGRTRARAYPLVPRYHHRERAVADHREGNSQPEISPDQPRRRELPRRRPRHHSRQDRFRIHAESQRGNDRAGRPEIDRVGKVHVCRRTRDRHARQRHPHRHRDAAAGRWSRTASRNI